MIAEHPQALSQTEAVKATGFELKVAEQSFYPTPSWVIERVQSQAHLDPAYAGASQVSTLRVQQPLWTGGRLTAQNNKAIAAQQIEVDRLLEVQQSLALKTLQAWLDVVSAQRQQQVLEQARQIQKSLLQKIKHRADLGYSSDSEVKLSQWRIAQATQEISQNALLEQLAWIRLKQWVPQADATASDTFDLAGKAAIEARHLQPLAALDWETLCLSQSPTMRRMLSTLALQVSEVLEKRAQLQPEIYLRLEHQRGNFAYANTPPINRMLVGMTANTGAGLSLQHQLSALTVKQEATQQEIGAVQRSLLESLQTDLMSVNERQSKVSTLRLNLQSAQDIESAWQRQFEAGKKSWMDVVNAVRETSQAKQSIIDNDMALQLSYWRLQVLAYGVTHWTLP